MVIPPLVLALICAVCCGLLVLANSVTRDKIAAAEAASIQDSLQELVDNLVGLSDTAAVDGVDGITGATYSSKGMKAAVDCALDTVGANQEVLGA